MLRVAVGLIGLCGCDLVFSLDRPDAAPTCPDSHDEDGDQALDCVDVCPGIFDSQDDDDADRVGDACDPNPNAPGDPDAILLFEPFANATALEDWQQLGAGGLWTVEGDKLVQSDGVANRVALLRAADPDTVPASLELRMQIESVDPVFTAFHVGVSASDNSLMTPHCTFATTGTFPTGGLTAFDETNITMGVTRPMLLLAGEAYLITLTQLDNTLRCAVTQLRTTTSVMTSTPLATPTTGGVYLANHGMKMKVDYVAVYGPPP